jgi:protein arginine N-methyltransferase 7
MNIESLQISVLRGFREKVDGNALGMIQVARQMQRSGLADEAIELASKALRLADGDPEVRILAADVMSKGVPKWHFNIVRDRARNAAYRAALERAVFPGCKVLEIGTGSGLLALMAAQAGAAEVITSEAEPALAHVAKINVAANGYADRIRVICKHSTELDVHADLGGPADILVSEIVSDDLLGEGVLSSHADAVSRLLKPGATIILSPVSDR